MAACKTHMRNPVRGYSECPGCEVKRLNAERDALQQRLNAVEEENDRLRTQLARMIGQAENMLEIAENCSDPDEDDDGNFDECREYIKSAEKTLENRS